MVESVMNRDFVSANNGPMVVMDEYTVTKSYGWVFFVNTRKYGETKDRRFTAIGYGVIVFRKADTSIHILQSCFSPEEGVARLERELGLSSE